MTTPSARGQTVSLNGMEIYVELQGEGEPLLLLHGFTGCGGDWALLAEGLPREYRWIVPDMRGHGRSTNPAGAFTHRQSALDLYALLDHLGIGRCKAVGISGGGNTLLHMATQQPARVEAMVLVSATTHFPAQARAVMSQFQVETLSEGEWELLRQRHVHGDGQIRSLWAQGNGFKDSYDDMNFTPPYLSTIAARTLVVSGDRDPFYPPSIALDMYAAIPRAYLWIIPNGGHTPVFGDMGPRFGAVASSFLRGEWEGQG